MGASILVVDDDPDVQVTFSQLLHAEGYVVATAGSGEEALTRLARSGFDVLVSDIKMPGLTGLDVLERSRALDPALAVILMTGYATIETAVEALRRGASDYLRKPFRVEELRQSVQRALSLRPAAESPGATAPVAPVVRGLRHAVRRFERQYVQDVLVAAGHDKREAARILEISLASLYRKLETP
jgi:DNA-binding NtrC family response regulator